MFAFPHFTDELHNTSRWKGQIDTPNTNANIVFTETFLTKLISAKSVSSDNLVDVSDIHPPDRSDSTGIKRVKTT